MWGQYCHPWYLGSNLTSIPVLCASASLTLPKVNSSAALLGAGRAWNGGHSKVYQQKEAGYGLAS